MARKLRIDRLRVEECLDYFWPAGGAAPEDAPDHERSQKRQTEMSSNPSWFHHRSSMGWSRRRIPSLVTPGGGGATACKRSKTKTRCSQFNPRQ